MCNFIMNEDVILISEQPQPSSIEHRQNLKVSKNNSDLQLNDEYQQSIALNRVQPIRGSSASII